MSIEKLTSVSGGGGYRGNVVPPIPVVLTNDQGTMYNPSSDSLPVPRFVSLEGGAAPDTDRDIEAVVGTIGTPVRYVLAPSVDHVLYISVLRMALGVGSLAGGDWPGVGAPLVNGCQLFIETSGAPDVSLIDDLPLKTTFDIYTTFLTKDIEATIGPNKLISAEAHFYSEIGGALILQAALGQKLVWTVRDDITAMAKMRLMGLCWEVPEA